MEHHFNVELAKKIGIEEAIFLHNLYFWIQKNASNKKLFFDGAYWTYNTKEAYADLFPYMSLSKVKRIIFKLTDACIIQTGNYNEKKMDRTLWYSFTECGLKMMKDVGYNVRVFGYKEAKKSNGAKQDDALSQNEPMEQPKMSQCNNNINNTDNNNKDTLDKSRVRERLSHKYNKDKELTEKEINFYVGMEENYPRIMKMDEPLLYRQYMALLAKGVAVEKIKHNLEAMENNKKIKERYSAYKTLLTYIRIDKNQYAPSIA